MSFSPIPSKHAYEVPMPEEPCEAQDEKETPSGGECSAWYPRPPPATWLVRNEAVCGDESGEDGPSADGWVDDYVDFAEYSSDDEGDPMWRTFDETMEEYYDLQGQAGEGGQPIGGDGELIGERGFLKNGLKKLKDGLKKKLGGTQLLKGNTWVTVVLTPYERGRMTELSNKCAELNALTAGLIVKDLAASTLQFRVFKPSRLRPKYKKFPVVTLRLQMPAAKLKTCEVDLPATEDAIQLVYVFDHAEGLHDVRVHWGDLAPEGGAGKVMKGIHHAEVKKVINAVFKEVQKKMTSQKRYTTLQYPELQKEFLNVDPKKGYLMFTEKNFSTVVNRSTGGTVDQLSLYYNNVAIALDTTKAWNGKAIKEVNSALKAKGTELQGKAGFVTVKKFPDIDAEFTAGADETVKSEGPSKGKKGDADEKVVKLRNLRVWTDTYDKRLFLSVSVYYRHVDKIISSKTGMVSKDAIENILKAWGSSTKTLCVHGAHFVGAEANDLNEFLIATARPLCAFLPAAKVNTMKLSGKVLKVGTGKDTYGYLHIQGTTKTTIGKSTRGVVLEGYFELPIDKRVKADTPEKLQALLPWDAVPASADSIVEVTGKPPRKVPVEIILDKNFYKKLYTEVNATSGSQTDPGGKGWAWQAAEWKEALQTAGFRPVVLLLHVTLDQKTSKGAWQKDVIPQVINTLRYMSADLPIEGQGDKIKAGKEVETSQFGTFDGVSDFDVGVIPAVSKDEPFVMYNAKIKTLRSGVLLGNIGNAEKLVPYVQLRFFLPKHMLDKVLEKVKSPSKIPIVGSKNTVEVTQCLKMEVTKAIVDRLVAISELPKEETRSRGLFKKKKAEKKKQTKTNTKKKDAKKGTKDEKTGPSDDQSEDEEEDESIAESKNQLQAILDQNGVTGGWLDVEKTLDQRYVMTEEYVSKALKNQKEKSKQTAKELEARLGTQAQFVFQLNAADENQLKPLKIDGKEAPKFEVSYHGLSNRQSVKKKGVISFYEGVFPFVDQESPDTILAPYIFMVMHKNTEKYKATLDLEADVQKTLLQEGKKFVETLKKTALGQDTKDKVADMVQQHAAVQKSKVLMRVVTPTFFTKEQEAAVADSDKGDVSKFKMKKAETNGSKGFRFVMNDLTPPINSVWGSGSTFETPTKMVAKFISPCMTIKKADGKADLKATLEKYAVENLARQAKAIIVHTWRDRAPEGKLDEAVQKVIGTFAYGPRKTQSKDKVEKEVKWGPEQLVYGRSYHDVFDELVNTFGARPPPEEEDGGGKETKGKDGNDGGKGSKPKAAPKKSTPAKTSASKKKGDKGMPPPDDPRLKGEPDLSRAKFCSNMLDFDISVMIQSWAFTLGPYMFKTNKAESDKEKFIKYSKIFAKLVAKHVFGFIRDTIIDIICITFPIRGILKISDLKIPNTDWNAIFSGAGTHAVVSAGSTHALMSGSLDEMGKWLIDNMYWALFDIVMPNQADFEKAWKNFRKNAGNFFKNIYSQTTKSIQPLKADGSTVTDKKELEIMTKGMSFLTSTNIKPAVIGAKGGGPWAKVQSFALKMGKGVFDLAVLQLFSTYVVSFVVGAIMSGVTAALGASTGGVSLLIQFALQAIGVRIGYMLIDMFHWTLDFLVEFFTRDLSHLYAFWTLSEYDSRILVSILARYKYVDPDGVPSRKKNAGSFTETEKPLVKILNQTMCRIKNQLQSGEQSIVELGKEKTKKDINSDVVTWSLFNTNAIYKPKVDKLEEFIKTLKLKAKGEEVLKRYDSVPRNMLQTLVAQLKLHTFAKFAGFAEDGMEDEEEAVDIGNYFRNSGVYAPIYMGSHYVEKMKKKETFRGIEGEEEEEREKRGYMSRLGKGKVNVGLLYKASLLLELVHGFDATKRGNVLTAPSPYHLPAHTQIVFNAPIPSFELGIVTVQVDERLFQFTQYGLDAALIEAVTGEPCDFLQDVQTSTFCHAHATYPGRSYRVCCRQAGATAAPASPMLIGWTEPTPTADDMHDNEQAECFTDRDVIRGGVGDGNDDGEDGTAVIVCPQTLRRAPFPVDGGQLNVSAVKAELQLDNTPLFFKDFETNDVLSFNKVVAGRTYWAHSQAPSSTSTPTTAAASPLARTKATLAIPAGGGSPLTASAQIAHNTMKTGNEVARAVAQWSNMSSSSRIKSGAQMVTALENANIYTREDVRAMSPSDWSTITVPIGLKVFLREWAEGDS